MTERKALCLIQEKLKKTSAKNEHDAIDAVFAVGNEILDGLDRLASAHERIAAALEDANKFINVKG